jgi:hypothetical protein
MKYRKKVFLGRSSQVTTILAPSTPLGPMQVATLNVLRMGKPETQKPNQILLQEATVVDSSATGLELAENTDHSRIVRFGVFEVRQPSSQNWIEPEHDFASSTWTYESAKVPQRLAGVRADSLLIPIICSKNNVLKIL